MSTRENCPLYDRDHLRYPSDVTDNEWWIIASMIPPGKPGGRQRAPLYVLSTGCQWRAIPKDLPPRSTIYDYFGLWDWDGTLARIHHELYVRCREEAGREASPTARAPNPG